MEYFNCLYVLIFALTTNTYVSSQGMVDQSVYSSANPKLTVRHVIARKNVPPSVSPSIMDLQLSKASAESKDDDTSKSEEIDFSSMDDSNSSSLPSPPPPPPPPSLSDIITQPNRVLGNYSSDDNLENHTDTEINSTGLHSQNTETETSDSSEPPSQNKIVREDAIAKDETVYINADADGVKLEKSESAGSNLWIYSNVVCILLVVVVSIFLIFHPKARCGRRAKCSDSSRSSSESSTSPSSAPV